MLLALVYQPIYPNKKFQSFFSEGDIAESEILHNKDLLLSSTTIVGGLSYLTLSKSISIDHDLVSDKRGLRQDKFGWSFV